MDQYLDGLVSEIIEPDGSRMQELVKSALGRLSRSIVDTKSSSSLQKAVVELELVDKETKEQFREFYLLKNMAYYSQAPKPRFGRARKHYCLHMQCSKIQQQSLRKNSVPETFKSRC